MKVKSESEVTHLCLTLSNPMDCSPPGSSVGFSRQEYCSGVPLPSPVKDMASFIFSKAKIPYQEEVLFGLKK